MTDPAAIPIPDPMASASPTDPASLTNADPSAPRPSTQPVMNDQAQLAILEAQVQKFTDLAARSQAELQNAKVRMEKDAKDLRQYASEQIILRLLPTVDNFQRAFQHLPEELKNHEWVKGVAVVEQDFIRTLSDLGLKKIESVGKPVDAHVHEVVTTGEGENGVILEVFEDGYELHGKVIRPAKVKAGQKI